MITFKLLEYLREKRVCLDRNLKSLHILRDKLAKSILFFEAILSLFLVVAVIIGVAHLGRVLFQLSAANIENTFTIFYDFLDYLLLLIIGLELIIMLVRHNAASVIEVLIFAIAREILIHANSMVEISLGIIALAGVLAIQKYLLINNLSDDYFGYILGAAVELEDVNKLMHIRLPLEKANTLGGLIARLAVEEEKGLKQGMILWYNNIEFEVLELKEGVIEKIRIAKQTT